MTNPCFGINYLESQIIHTREERKLVRGEAKGIVHSISIILKIEDSLRSAARWLASGVIHT